MTKLTRIYNRFFSMITDDLGLNCSKEEIEADCESLLLSSISLFEYPKKSLNLIEDEIREDCYIGIDSDLNLEELNILASGMVRIWLQREINSIDLIKQKFSGNDFKLTSQASHLEALEKSLEKARLRHRDLQIIYSKRTMSDGTYATNFDQLYSRY